MQENNTHPVGLPALANLRRRVLPLASTAAALGLAGCSLSPLAFWQRSQPAPAAPESAASQKTAAQVQAFTAGVETALDRADPDTAVRPVHRKPPDGVAAAPEPPPRARRAGRQIERDRVFNGRGGVIGAMGRGSAGCTGIHACGAAAC